MPQKGEMIPRLEGGGEKKTESQLEDLWKDIVCSIDKLNKAFQDTNKERQP